LIRIPHLAPPDETRRLIEAAGKRGGYPFKDKMLVRMVYRHGLRASEAMGWSLADLDLGVIDIVRVKGSNDNMRSLDRGDLRDMRKLGQHVTGLYVFATERGGPLSVDALQYTVRESGREARLDMEVHLHMLRRAAGYTLANEGGHKAHLGLPRPHRDPVHSPLDGVVPPQTGGCESPVSSRLARPICGL
jgi:integrase